MDKYPPSTFTIALFTCSCPKGSWAVVRGKNGDRVKVELYAQGGKLYQYMEQKQPGKFSPQSISRGVLRAGGRCGNN